MDAVILAGGKGARLDGVMPPYWKPLLPSNGEPLFVRVARQARPFVRNLFIIAAPENALQIAQVLPREWRGYTYIIVQPTPNGPGDALYYALELTRAQTVLVLMGDNYMPDEDVRNVADEGIASGYAIGVSHTENEVEARRFTRLFDDGLTIEEGPDVTPHDDGKWTLWCGPLVLPVDAAKRAIKNAYLDQHRLGGEVKIGANLRYIGQQPALVECSAIDIGTPETALEVEA